MPCLERKAYAQTEFIKLPAYAQEKGHVPRVGILVYGEKTDPEIMARLAAFRNGMQELGWAADAKLRIDALFATNNDDLPEKAKELADIAPDVLVANTPPAVLALLKLKRPIPIVFAAVTDPVGLGIVKNLAHPGGNVTGFLSSEFGFGAKWLELLRRIAPSVQRVIVLSELGNPSASAQFAAVQTAASQVGVELNLLVLDDVDSLERGISELARSGNGGLIALRLTQVISNRALIIKLADRYRLPAVYPLHIFAADGGLVSYGPDISNEFRQAASYVDRILKGEKPADLPVQAPTKYELVINLKTAKSLGLTIPSSILAQADHVIE